MRVVEHGVEDAGAKSAALESLGIVNAGRFFQDCFEIDEATRVLLELVVEVGRHGVAQGVRVGDRAPGDVHCGLRHHSDDVDGESALIRLADMLAHYGNGQPLDPAKMIKVARTIGLSGEQLRAIMYELPYPQEGQRRQIDPCPLSAREVEVLRRLAEGKVYKQIALELNLSTSTVRTHLHNTYAKLGAVDRAQAVLLATQRGWL